MKKRNFKKIMLMVTVIALSLLLPMITNADAPAEGAAIDFSQIFNVISHNALFVTIVGIAVVLFFGYFFYKAL